MKIMAIENELCPLILGEKEILNYEQKKAIHNLYLEGYIREVFKKDESESLVIILECSSRREAEHFLAKLPLVRAGKSTFDIVILSPFDGFKEFFK